MRNARRIIGCVTLLAILSYSSMARGAFLTPNDPYYSYQNVLTAASPAEASISRAWDITTDASQVVVAVIDTGVDLEHPDLQDNLWINSGEVEGDGIDNDGNGYIDDVHGYDFRHRDGDPEDEWGHGTLIAGIIGAEGNNGIGTVGVAWHTQLMILKVFGASGGARLEDYVGAIRYAIANGANIINASWIIPPQAGDLEIESLKQAIREAQEAGVIVNAAAGNNAQDLDQNPVYPAAYSELFDNVVSVAGLNDSGGFLEESNYGLHTVTLAAPGENIVGTYLEEGYATLTGTSAATAVVSGVAALILSQHPELSASDIVHAMVSQGTAESFLTEKVLTGAILNPRAALASLSSDSEDGTDQSGGGRVSGAVEITSGSIPSSAASGGCSLVPEF